MTYVKNVYFVKTKKTRAHFEYLFVHSVAGRLVSLFFYALHDEDFIKLNFQHRRHP